MQPLSQAVLLEAFPPQDRGKAMGFWGLGIVVAPILGPVLGGWLTDTYSWRWVFYINLPVGIASLVMTKLYVFDPPYLRRETKRDRLLGHRHAGGVASARCSSCSIRGRSDDWFVVAVHRRRWRSSPAVGADRACSSASGRPRSRSSTCACSRIRSYSTGVFLMTIARVRALRQPGAAADHAADAARLSVAAGRASRWRRAASGRCIGMPLVGMLIGKIDPRKMVARRAGRRRRARCSGSAQLNLHAGYWDIFWPQFLQGARRCRCCSCR